MDLKVGILGGGQLGRMLTQAAKRLGISVTVIDPSPDCPAAQVGAEQIVGSFSDEAAIEMLASKCDVLTVEIEHVNAEALGAVVAKLNASRKNENKRMIHVQPSPATIALVQDKFLQKQHMKTAGIPLGDFKSADTLEEARAVAQEFGYPIMLKSRKLAYDGRGNFVVHTPEQFEEGWNLLSTKGKLYLEKWVPFRRELAVIVARSTNGTCVSYDAVETIQRDNVCHVVVCPAQVDGEILSKARNVASKAVAQLEGAGVYGVELFELVDGSIYLNEMAPRVHNSGHLTIEACYTSQFEQHIRAVCGLPLGDCSMQVGASVMINVLGTGAAMEDADRTWAICQRALATPGASVHWYGKKGTAKGRKVGHITLTGKWATEVLRTAAELLRPSTETAAGKSSAASAASSAVTVTGAGASTTSSPSSSPSSLPSWATTNAPTVGIIMGSDSDLPVMIPAAEILRDFGVPFEVSIVSAHRTPARLVEYANTARTRGLKVIIAAAGGAAHLPGMVAAMTPLPVIGVPVPLKHLDGVDSLHSIVQMPRGVPVATVAIGNSTNAALLAIRMLGSFVPSLCDKMEQYQRKIEEEVLHKVKVLEHVGWENYGKPVSSSGTGGSGGK